MDRRRARRVGLPMRTILSRTCCLALAMAGAAHAQTPAGGSATGGSSGAAPGLGISAPASVQPASGSSQVRQPPANSAMRRSGGGSAGSGGAANPMGMAGLGMSATNSLSLSSGGAISGAGGQEIGQSASSRSAQQGSSVRISDTGVTQRQPNGTAGHR
jgi:hypothetical protein